MWFRDRVVVRLAGWAGYGNIGRDVLLETHLDRKIRIYDAYLEGKSVWKTLILLSKLIKLLLTIIKIANALAVHDGFVFMRGAIRHTGDGMTR